jgi:hypothetical protein
LMLRLELFGRVHVNACWMLDTQMDGEIKKVRSDCVEKKLVGT